PPCTESSSSERHGAAISCNRGFELALLAPEATKRAAGTEIQSARRHCRCGEALVIQIVDAEDLELGARFHYSHMPALTCQIELTVGGYGRREVVVDRPTQTRLLQESARHRIEGGKDASFFDQVQHSLVDKRRRDNREAFAEAPAHAPLGQITCPLWIDRH